MRSKKPPSSMTGMFFAIADSSLALPTSLTPRIRMSVRLETEFASVPPYRTISSRRVSRVIELRVPVAVKVIPWRQPLIPSGMPMRPRFGGRSMWLALSGAANEKVPLGGRSFGRFGLAIFGLGGRFGT
jgi:hypothetical protein